ncbi:MAG: hypothetical protein IKH54_07480 [Bacilli bacterium]|nr:hypothetical protein [Bacilli bacterium]
MLKNKNSLLIILGVALVSLGAVSIAFAALSRTLNITHGNVTQSALTWDVGFVAGTYTGDAYGTSSNGRSCGNITATRSTLTVANTTLSKPGDKCSYYLASSNDGSLDAYLQSITYTQPTSTTCTIVQANTDEDYQYGYMTCGNLRYYLDSSCDYLNNLESDDIKNFYLTVEYIGNSLNGSAVTQRNAKITISYTENQNLKLFASGWEC